MSSASKKLLTVLRIAVGIGLLVYVISVTGGWETILKLGDSPWILVALPIAPLLGAAVEAIRLKLLCLALRIHISFARGYQLVAIGTLYSLVLPGGTGGDVVKLYYMARENRGRMVESGLVLLVDRAVALFGLLLLILMLALLNLNLVLENTAIGWLVVAAAAAAIGIILFMQMAFSTRLRQGKLYAFATRKLPLGRFLARVLEALYAFREHKRAILVALAWSLCGHLVLAAMLLALGTVLMPDAPVRILPFLSLLGSLASVIPITPGGIGVGEAATEKLYSLVGISGGAALILSWRLSTLPLCAIGAIFSIAGVRRRSSASTADEEPTATTVSTE